MQRKCSEANEEGWHEVQSGRVRSLPNQGDGDCLFRAISHQLGGALLAPQLRQHAVDYMENHLEAFTPQLLALGDDMADSGEIPAEQLQNPALPQLVLNILRLPWTWGGAECTAALARFLGRPIHIYLEHDATIVFHPIQQEEGAAAIRILHRFGNNGRRSHYESVLLWEPARAEQPQQAPAVEESSDAVQDDQPPENEVRPLGMELRSRPRCEPALNFRAEIFSDAEECQDVSQRIRKYRACRMCGIRVGRYGLMYCGAYPVCGTCIQEQFVININLCNHCGNPVHGWMKVFNQN